MSFSDVSLSESTNMLNKKEIDEIISFSLVLMPKYLDNELINNSVLKLDNKTILLLKKILSYYPDVIEGSKNILLSIIDDGKIDLKDVPKVIIIINRLYVIIYKLKKEFSFLDTQVTSQIAGEVVKFIIYILIEEKLIKLDESKKEDFLKLTDSLIDTTTTLFVVPKMTKKEIKGFSLCSCFHGL